MEIKKINLKLKNNIQKSSSKNASINKVKISGLKHHFTVFNYELFNSKYFIIIFGIVYLLLAIRFAKIYCYFRYEIL